MRLKSAVGISGITMLCHGVSGSSLREEDGRLCADAISRRRVSLCRKRSNGVLGTRGVRAILPAQVYFTELTRTPKVRSPPFTLFCNSRGDSRSLLAGGVSKRMISRLRRCDWSDGIRDGDCERGDGGRVGVATDEIGSVGVSIIVFEGNRGAGDGVEGVSSEKTGGRVRSACDVVSEGLRLEVVADCGRTAGGGRPVEG